MQSKIARLVSGPVRYLEAGTGTPMVLIHAFPLSAEQWLPQLARPLEGWRLIAPDLRGFGRTLSSGLGGVSIDTYAADVFELMAHLEIPRAAVTGLSMGGYVALAMVARDAARVTGLVLADTRANADSEDGRAARGRMIELVRRDGPPGVASEMVPKLLGPATRAQQPDLVDAVTLLIESNPPDGIEAAIGAMRDRPDRSALLSTITCPTVIVCGEDDALTPLGECETMSRQIPGARFVRVPGAGHLSNLENPVVFASAIATVASPH